VFLVPSPAYSHISSSLVRDIAALGGSVDGLVPEAVVKALARRREGATTRKA
jgi:pantetheine-phosphate adenylyltransferase